MVDEDDPPDRGHDFPVEFQPFPHELEFLGQPLGMRHHARDVRHHVVRRDCAAVNRTVIAATTASSSTTRGRRHAPENECDSRDTQGDYQNPPVSSKKSKHNFENAHLTMFTCCGQTEKGRA